MIGKIISHYKILEKLHQKNGGQVRLKSSKKTAEFQDGGQVGKTISYHIA